MGSRGRAGYGPGMDPLATGLEGADLRDYLSACREGVLAELRARLPPDGPRTGGLYGLVLDYPLRDAKALRPALAVATARALGASMDLVLPSALTLELYHNAFLVHDDVEDASELRRGQPTLHRAHGVAVAMNVGDAMLALTLGPLLENMETVGLSRALRVLSVVERMARESAEGQAIELDWIRRNAWDLGPTDYFRMVWKKTAWYTFIAPVTVGAIVAGLDAARTRQLQWFAGTLGLAFQVQDDLLSLEGAVADTGKEEGGDLWEGKRTLMLLHALRVATPAARARGLEALARERAADAALPAQLAAWVEAGRLDAGLRVALEGALTQGRGFRTAADVEVLRALIEESGARAVAREAALVRAERARRQLTRIASWMPPSPHRDLLAGLVAFVVGRDR